MRRLETDERGKPDQVMPKQLPSVSRGFGLTGLRASLESADVRVSAVSQWSVGMHVHHCCLSTIGVSRALINSTPPPPRSRPSAMGSFLLLIGRIPRGRARSADVVLPDPEISPDELRDLLDESERVLTEVRTLDPQAWFRHFVFGVLTRDRALRFTRIHNRHHLRIISDIVAAG